MSFDSVTPTEREGLLSTRSSQFSGETREAFEKVRDHHYMKTYRKLFWYYRTGESSNNDWRNICNLYHINVHNWLIIMFIHRTQACIELCFPVMCNSSDALPFKLFPSSFKTCLKLFCVALACTGCNFWLLALSVVLCNQFCITIDWFTLLISEFITILFEWSVSSSAILNLIPCQSMTYPSMT